MYGEGCNRHGGVSSERAGLGAILPGQECSTRSHPTAVCSALQQRPMSDVCLIVSSSMVRFGFLTQKDAIGAITGLDD